MDLIELRRRTAARGKGSAGSGAVAQASGEGRRRAAGDAAAARCAFDAVAAESEERAIKGPGRRTACWRGKKSPGRTRTPRSALGRRAAAGLLREEGDSVVGWAGLATRSAGP